MQKEPLKVGIMGIGLYATAAHVPQLRSTGRAEVTAICRRDADKLAFSQKQLNVAETYTDWRDMLARADLDAVVISTPHDVHAEQTQAALARGLHVLVEKPMALTLEDSWKMKTAAEAAGRVLMVGYNRRFSGLWRAAKDRLATDGIGQIRQINLHLAVHRRLYWDGTPLPESFRATLRNFTGWPDEFLDPLEQGTDWRADATASGGGMFSNTGTHIVDLILWLGGAHAVDVVAFSENAGMPAECFLGIQARLANRVLVSLSTADVASGGITGKGELTIIGEEGTLNHNFAQPAEVWWSHGDQRELVTAQYPDTNAAAAFVDTILDGAPNLCTARDGALAVAFSEAVYRSAAENQVVALELPQATA